jgi:hypothetical protein
MTSVADHWLALNSELARAKHQLIGIGAGRTGDGDDGFHTLSLA